jgi:hypothetical protein
MSFHIGTVLTRLKSGIGTPERRSRFPFRQMVIGPPSFCSVLKFLTVNVLK